MSGTCLKRYPYSTVGWLLACFMFHHVRGLVCTPLIISMAVEGGFIEPRYSWFCDNGWEGPFLGHTAPEEGFDFNFQIADNNMD